MINNDSQYIKMATLYPIINGKKIAFSKIIAPTKKSAVSKNLKASRRYSVFTMLLGFFVLSPNKTLNKCNEVKTAMPLPIKEDLALSKPKK